MIPPRKVPTTAPPMILAAICAGAVIAASTTAVATRTNGIVEAVSAVADRTRTGENWAARNDAGVDPRPPPPRPFPESSPIIDFDDGAPLDLLREGNEKKKKKSGPPLPSRRTRPQRVRPEKERPPLLGEEEEETDDDDDETAFWMLRDLAGGSLSYSYSYDVDVEMDKGGDDVDVEMDKGGDADADVEPSVQNRNAPPATTKYCSSSSSPSGEGVIEENPSEQPPNGGLVIEFQYSMETDKVMDDTEERSIRQRLEGALNDVVVEANCGGNRRRGRRLSSSGAAGGGGGADEEDAPGAGADDAHAHAPRWKIERRSLPDAMEATDDRDDDDDDDGYVRAARRLKRRMLDSPPGESELRHRKLEGASMSWISSLPVDEPLRDDPCVASDKGYDGCVKYAGKMTAGWDGERGDDLLILEIVKEAMSEDRLLDVLNDGGGGVSAARRGRRGLEGNAQVTKVNYLGPDLSSSSETRDGPAVAAAETITVQDDDDDGMSTGAKTAVAVSSVLLLLLSAFAIRRRLFRSNNKEEPFEKLDDRAIDADDSFATATDASSDAPPAPLSEEDDEESYLSARYSQLGRCHSGIDVHRCHSGLCHGCHRPRSSGGTPRTTSNILKDLLAEERKMPCEGIHEEGQEAEWSGDAEEREEQEVQFISAVPGHMVVRNSGPLTPGRGRSLTVVNEEGIGEDVPFDEP